MLQKLRSALRLLQKDRKLFLSAILGSIQRYGVYVRSTEGVDGASHGLFEFRKVTDAELTEIASSPETAYQLERLEEIRSNKAWGVFSNGRLVHVSWLITAEDNKHLPVRILELGKGEAEITTCYTVPEYRGKGAYPFAVRHLCAIAAQRGIKQIYMICAFHNTSSIAGIEKAGLKHCGSVTRYVVPLKPSAPGIFLRSYRSTAPACA